MARAFHVAGRRKAGPSYASRSGCSDKFVVGMGKPQISPLRYPEFLLRLVALANFMRLSSMKAAHVDLSDVAKQEFGTLRSR
jgi:hypothetical protein